MAEGKVGFHINRILDKSGLNSGKLDFVQSHQPPNQQPENTTTILCPSCGSRKVWKDGFRYGRSNGAAIQRWLCRACGLRFSQKAFNGSKTFQQLPTVHTKSLKRGFDISSKRQVCELLTEDSKNLATSETRTQEKAAGATTSDQATIKGKLIEFAFWLQKQGYDEVTRKKRFYKLQRLAQLGANLWNPENVKEILAKQKSWQDPYKRQIVYAYENFMTMENLTWKRPLYKRSDRAVPFIPTEAELDKLISSCGKKVGTFLQGLKDTGADPGELAAITWMDVNPERKTVTLNRPVKGHNPRILKISQDFIDRLESLPKTSEKIFSLHTINGLYYRQRKRITNKLANPRLIKIALTTFRDWKLTMVAHKTRDPFQVMATSGHKSMQSIMFYIDLAKVVFGPGEHDEFTVRIANNVGEASTLIEAGFEYITGEYSDGGKLFRKRK